MFAVKMGGLRHPLLCLYCKETHVQPESINNNRMFDNVKYTTFEYEFGGSFSSTSTYGYVKLPYENNGGKKVMFVLDYMPTEDLKEGKLLSGQTGTLLTALSEAAFTLELKKRVKFSWLACTYNAFKTAGTSREFQFAARAAFASRVRALVNKYKPDIIVTFGHSAASVFLSAQLEATDKNLAHWYGIPLKVRATKEHECVVCPTLSLNSLVDGTSAASGMLGFVVRNLANAYTAQHRYAIDDQHLRASKSVLVDTVSKFDKLLDHVAAQEVVAVDTETDNLNRIVNRLLTLQFAVNDKTGYIVPLYHKDTPFTPSELKHIKKRLRGYFEGDNDNKYHIYANADFDLNVLRNQLGTRHMHNDVWDIFAGQFCQDENYKFLQNISGEYYYSLAVISSQFGFTGYHDASFSKKDRANISRTDLNEGVLRYMSYDVVVPYAIHEMQKRIARDKGHKHYETMVRSQISDTLHMFSRMESNGSGLDVKYLFYLRTPNSPIEQTIAKMEGQLLEMESVRKANRILQKRQGVPSKGLWGTADVNLFSFRKDDHKQLLFFKVLGLEPLATGAKGAGKLDKEFQSRYADVPEVAAYTELGKARKLRNAYVRSFIKLLGSSEDLKYDHRIRPSYGYLKVLTGRTNASDPNLQQVPSRSELGKLIKRLFIARQGRIYIKVDYKVHEVRGWGIISFDKALANIFKAARELRNKYRLNPTPELFKRLEFEADVHIVNVMYFFSKTIEELMADKKLKKTLRDAVKGVIFGLIYQMSIKSLAASIKQSFEYAENLVKNFRKRFPAGMKWIEDVKTFARKHLYFENPLGLRRHLWGYLYPKNAMTCSNRVWAEMDRRAVNSPIQGMGAQFMSIGSRYLDRMIFTLWKKEKRDVDYAVCNSVHDSLETEFAYRDVLLGIKYIEYALIDGVRKTVDKRYGMKLVVDVDIDFEIGASLSNTRAWDDSLVQLEEYVYDSLVFQRDELGYDVVVADAMKEVFVDGWPDAPSWMVQQAKNTGWKFDYAKYKRLDKERNNKSAKEQA